jgi:hypothetical protein
MKNIIKNLEELRNLLKFVVLLWYYMFRVLRNVKNIAYRTKFV